MNDTSRTQVRFTSGRRRLAIAAAALLTSALAFGGVLPAHAMTTDEPVAAVLSADPLNSMYTVTQGSQDVEVGAHRVMVELRDKDGSAVSLASGEMLTSSTSQDLGKGRISDWTYDGVTYVATITSTKEGFKKIDVTLNGAPIQAGRNTTAEFTAPVPDLSRSTVQLEPARAAIGEEIMVIVTLVDAAGNPVKGRVDALGLSVLQQTTPIVEGAWRELGDGRYGMPLTAKDAGSARFFVHFEETMIGTPLVGEWTAPTAPPAALLENAKLSVSTHEAVADGVHEVFVEVTVLDEKGQPYQGDAVVELSTDRGTLVAHNLRTMGRTAILTSEEAGDAIVSFRLDGKLSTQTETVTFTAAEAEVTPPVEPETGTGTETGAGPETGTTGPATTAPLTDGSLATPLAATGLDQPVWPGTLLALVLGGLGILILVARRRILSR